MAVIVQPSPVGARRPVGVWLARALILLVSLTLPFLGLEWALRTFGPFLPGNYTTYLYLEPHSVYGFFHVPNTSGWLKSDEYTVRVDINARGLRERDLPYQKPAGVRRVLVLGDSFVEGAQVRADQLLTRHLESLLVERTGERWEVINAGVAAWGTAQEYLYLKHEGFRYEPDLVVSVFYAGNDVTNNSNKIKRTVGRLRKPYYEVSSGGELRALPFTPRAPREETFEGRLRRESLVYALLDVPISRIRGTIKRDAEDDEENDNPERQLVQHELPVFSSRTRSQWEDAWRVTEALLAEMNNESRAQRIPILFVNAPTKWEIYAEDWTELKKRNDLREDGWDLEGPRRRLTEIANRQTLDYLDLHPALSAASPSPRLYYQRDIHWTPAGHQATAQAIADRAIQRLRAPS